ncbi:oxidoreductase [Candidatus Parcubacteria bacterium]|nr:oxidoreductase [Candidatus Parcubacteria bacterium]
METPGKNNATPSTDLRRLWQAATLVRFGFAAGNVKSLVFKVPEWVKHLPGQHYDIRLTSATGYQAERSYSAASAPESEGVIELGVEFLEKGEVSPYLWNLKEGGKIEIRGPIGGHFIWTSEMPGPLVLIGGGSGMVPLMSMLRHYHLTDTSRRPIVFLISARSLDRVLYKEELEELMGKHPNLSVVITLTDEAPSDWVGYKRRVDSEMLQEVLAKVSGGMPMTYICGPTGFVEAVSRNLVAEGAAPHLIRTERFG